MSNMINRFHMWADAMGEKLKDKEIEMPVDLAVGILFLLVSLFLLIVMPQQITVSEKDVVDGRAFPYLLIGIMAVCCGLLIAREVFKIVRGQPVNRKTINLLVEIKAGLILLILIASYILCRVTGLFVIGAVFCCLGFLFYFRCRKISYHAITIILAVGIWAAFRFALGVDF